MIGKVEAARPRRSHSKMNRHSLEIVLGLGFCVIFLLLVLRLPNAAMESLALRYDERQATQAATLPQSSSQAAKPIRQISILGERNSGTRWTYE
jgi:hypothetical protein